MRSLVRSLVLVSLGILAIPAIADESAPVQKGVSPAKMKQYQLHNLLQSTFGDGVSFMGEIGWGQIEGFNKQTTGALRPYAEYEPAETLFFSARNNFGSKVIKEALLREVPAGVDVVLYTDDEASVAGQEQWARYIAPQTSIKVISIPLKGDQFWTRDALPVPVWTGSEGAETLGLVDARYYHKFEPDQVVASGFHAPLFSHSYYYEGGNFVADAKGNCFLIDSGTGANIPDSVLQNQYGCATVSRLPFVAGIGHADERIKILSDKLAVTDTASYVPYLEAKGFEVRMLPKLYPAGGDRTYANSLLVNGTIFLPVFKNASDDEAIRVYEDAGFRVVPLDSRWLSDGGRGSIHCVTMTYPAEVTP